MAAETSNPIEKLRLDAAKIGIDLPDTLGQLPNIGCFGYKLPDIYIWFCRNYSEHSNFPHHGWEPVFGLLSPFGHESELQRHNAMLRNIHPDWPKHWISFWHGNDGDFCFSFDQDKHPWIIYWYYNAKHSDEDADLYFQEDIAATDFIDWFSSQVEWILKQTK